MSVVSQEGEPAPTPEQLAATAADAVIRRFTVAYALGATFWLVVSNVFIVVSMAASPAALWPSIGGGTLLTVVTAAILYGHLRKTLGTLYAADARRRPPADVLGAAFMSLPLPVLAVDLRGQVTLWGPASERVFGWTADEVLGKVLPNELRQVLQAALQARDPVAYRASHRRGDASPVDVNIWSAPLYTSAGEVSGLVAIVVDVTAQKQAEAVLQRYRLITENTHDIVLFLAQDGQIIDANQAASNAYGYDREALLRCNITDLRVDEPRLLVPEQMQQADSEGITFQTVHRRADGTIFPVEVSSVGCDIDGRRTRLSIIRDITERREREHQREVLLRMERLQIVGQMASGVAHDLNQSLAIIAGYCELSRHAVDEAKPDLSLVRSYLTVIEEAAHDGGDTVRRLLSYTRVHPDRPRERIDLGQLLQDVARFTAPRWRDAAQAEGRSLSLVVHAEEALTIEGWAWMLREALTNLVFNAIDALPTGGAIQLHGRRDGDDAVAIVEDNGIGMSPAIKARIFEPFFTTKGESGTGLGLPMVLSAVQAHQGQMEVSSRAGDGTSIRLTFPLARPFEPGEPSDVDGVSQRPLRILAADDEPRLVALVAALLQRLGHQITTATNGDEVLDHLAAGIFDTLITDLSMGPGINGWELAARAHELYPTLRIVLATGWAGEIDSLEAARRGVSAVVSKPYRIAHLVRALSAAASPSPVSRHPGQSDST